MAKKEKSANQRVLYRPHPGPQTEFHRRLEDIALYGGSKGGGKTEALVGEAARQTPNKNYHGLLVRRTFPKLQELIDRAHVFYAGIGAKWSGDLKRYLFPSGSYVEFGHCASEIDKERYQGHEYQFIGFDQLEEFTESQFNFIMAQNRTSDPTLNCYVRATANPGSIGHRWVKRRFIDNKEASKTYTQVFDLGNNKKVTRTTVFIPSTIRDNPTLMEANPTYLANLMALPEIEKKAFLDGDWNAFSSQCVFDAKGMQIQEGFIEKPIIVGFLQEFQESYRLMPDEKGMLKVWETPRQGQEYEIGVDVAEGDSEGDYSSAHVVNRKTWEVVSHWWGHIDPLKFAEVLFSLGRYFNIAELAVEVNGPGIATLSRLKEKGYANLYSVDGKDGFRTDARTRFNMIATLLEAVKTISCRIKDRDTIDEMYDFIRNPATQKMEARESCHDDRVMSLGIALQCVRTNPLYEPPLQSTMLSRRGQAIIRREDGRKTGTGYRG